MSLFDSNKVEATIVPPTSKIGLTTLLENESVAIKRHDYYFHGKEIVAVYGDIAVFYEPYLTKQKIHISTSGLEGETQEVAFNSTNFPNLISGSTARHFAIVPFSRRKTSTAEQVYVGENWRLCVFTDKGQIFHNFPSRANGYDGNEQEGDMMRFDESVVWDLPERKFPTKTTSGDDATLIATGCYRYLPCLPDAMYAKHPAINSDNGYGNGGFGATIEYNETDGTTTKRPRLFYPIRTNGNANLFSWMSGYVQDKQVTMFGTYMPNTADQGCRMCVFASSDGGRQWFVKYEFGANGRLIKDDTAKTEIVHATNNYSEFGSADNQLVWGSNSMTDASAFSVKRRSQFTPSEDKKEPEHLFYYDGEVAVTSIVSASNGITITTAANHGFYNGEVVIFKKNSLTATDWDWIASEDEDADSAGNGVIWKVKRLTNTTFKLMLEVHNPYNNLCIRHIHAINRCKDGYSISCGEEYPNGWVVYLIQRNSDSHAFLFAGLKTNAIRITSTDKSVQRCLGVQILDDADNSVYAGLDTAVIRRDDVAMPSGRVESFYRNSCGLFKMKLVDVDDFNNAECVLNMSQPTYFFKIIDGTWIWAGQSAMLAVSTDAGKSWTQIQLPTVFDGLAEWIGVTSKKEICIKRYTYADTLVICPKM